MAGNVLTADRFDLVDPSSHPVPQPKTLAMESTPGPSLALAYRPFRQATSSDSRWPQPEIPRTNYSICWIDSIVGKFRQSGSPCFILPVATTGLNASGSKFPPAQARSSSESLTTRGQNVAQSSRCGTLLLLLLKILLRQHRVAIEGLVDLEVVQMRVRLVHRRHSIRCLLPGQALDFMQKTYRLLTVTHSYQPEQPHLPPGTGSTILKWASAAVVSCPLTKLRLDTTSENSNEAKMRRDHLKPAERGA